MNFNTSLKYTNFDFIFYRFKFYFIKSSNIKFHFLNIKSSLYCLYNLNCVQLVFIGSSVFGPIIIVILLRLETIRLFGDFVVYLSCSLGNPQHHQFR